MQIITGWLNSPQLTPVCIKIWYFLVHSSKHYGNCSSYIYTYVSLMCHIKAQTFAALCAAAWFGWRALTTTLPVLADVQTSVITNKYSTALCRKATIHIFDMKWSKKSSFSHLFLFVSHSRDWCIDGRGMTASHKLLTNSLCQSWQSIDFHRHRQSWLKLLNWQPVRMDGI